MSDPVVITARCHPELEGVLPRPVAASEARPDWLTAMPGTAPSDLHGGEEVRTLKHCPPLIDALSIGLLIPLACDVHVRNGELSWDWEVPAMPDQLLVRSPISGHLPEQATGVQFAVARQMVVKFMNFWTLEAPAGWSVLFTHPVNRYDLPFMTLSGVVDCDRFADGLVHFPALWTQPDFEGVLAAGTPVAQAIPVPRAGLVVASEVQDAGRAQATAEIQAALQVEQGHYRKAVRASRKG